MARLSNARVLVSLVCALFPAVAACGGGDAGAAAEGDETAQGGAASQSDDTKPEDEERSSGGAPSEQQEEAEEEPAGTGGSSVDEEEPVVDDEAPSIISTFPADGEAGVNADSAIEIEFSEPMDQGSVEDAYQSDDLPTDAVDFEWNDDGTKLTITPKEPLVYAEGKSVEETMAKSYSVTIGAAAADLAHNELGEDAALSFTTLREIFANIEALPELSGFVNLTTQVGGASIQVGDSLIKHTFRGMFSFELASVPEEHQLISAEVVARQGSVKGAPFTDLSLDADPAPLELFARSFANRAEAATGEVIGTDLGLFSDSPDAGPRSLMVTEHVGGQLEHRESFMNMSQYVLQFPVLTDKDATPDVVVYTGVTLQLDYLTP